MQYFYFFHCYSNFPCLVKDSLTVVTVTFHNIFWISSSKPLREDIYFLFKVVKMWPLNTCVTSVCAASTHMFLFTIFNIFKNVCRAYVNLCTLWMHYLSWILQFWNRDVSFQKAVNHSGFLWSSLFPFQTLPQCGIVLEILPGKFSEWDNVPFSVNGIQCFCHFWTLLQIQEGRCGTTGSRSLNGAYLHLYTTLPWIWKEGLFSLKELEHQPFESLFQRNLKTTLQLSLPYQPGPGLMLSVRVVPWVLEQWRLHRHLVSGPHGGSPWYFNQLYFMAGGFSGVWWEILGQGPIVSVRMYTSNFIMLFQRFVFNVSKYTLPYAQSEVVEAFLIHSLKELILSFALVLII